jgi:hypothetical protein
MISQALLQLNCESDWLVPTGLQDSLVASHRAVVLIASFTVSLLKLSWDFLPLASHLYSYYAQKQKSHEPHLKVLFPLCSHKKIGGRKKGTLATRKEQN